MNLYDIHSAIQSSFETVDIEGGVWQDYAPEGTDSPYAVWTPLAPVGSIDSQKEFVEVHIETNVWGLLENQTNVPGGEVKRSILGQKSEALTDALHTELSGNLPAGVTVISIFDDEPQTITVDRLHGQVKREHRIRVET